MTPDDSRRWADRLHASIARAASGLFNRAAVVAETTSTQDEAVALAGGRPGLVLMAGTQTAGRGRLGRKWDQGQGQGLAMTFAIDPRDIAPGHASLAAGVAVADAVEMLASASVGLRWPNDVVLADGRKIAGVLIEARAGLLLLGIGVNVGQSAADWPEALRGRAASLRDLGCGAECIDVAAALVTSLDDALRQPFAAITGRWRQRDVLTGRRAAFLHDGFRYEGLVEGIDPTSEINVRTPAGELVRLPTLSTSMVHDGQPSRL